MSSAAFWLALLVPADGPASIDGATDYLPRANVERLLRDDPKARAALDRLVKQAESGARVRLPLPAYTPGDALRMLRDGNRAPPDNYWIGEYRGWYFFCHQADQRPMLWFHSDMVRVGGREAYHFGSW
jgi:hypothetical protein